MPTPQPNRLIKEKSPYLLQHAYNPVDWFPWGDEAFEKARREDKPIFLSIGYSTCYWCHVMEKESFENPEIGKLMNEQFVSIKVDREERPDLDAVYMAAVQALSGQGGWPMTVLLTPDGRPFWGGTYFPPEDRQGRPGMRTIIQSIANAWQNRRDEIDDAGRSVTEMLRSSTRVEAGAPLGHDVLETAYHQFGEQFDPSHGGFGTAPKFPRTHVLSFLLRFWSRSRTTPALEMVENTLLAMARGGIRDQLGGGFHRYSTDAVWLAPHFEKMLYDQALIAVAYLEAYQATKRDEYAEVARDTFGYVLRDLRDPGGAFYAAEDAGEVGREGEFYTWSPDEVGRVLTPEEFELASRYFDVTPEGNFEGHSILRRAQPLEELAERQKLTRDEARALIASARAKLFAARNERPRPHRDDKILTDWNGLMIGALAYGARALEEPAFAEAAARAAEFLLNTLRRDGRLLHRYRDGSADVEAFLDDYAFLAWGLTELYHATGEPRWLEEALRLTDEQLASFWDPDDGGFFFTGSRNEQLIARTKELYDGALPSGNSMAALNLVRLGQLTTRDDFKTKSEQMFQAFAAPVNQMPHAFPQCLIALDQWLGPGQEIVIAGDPDDAVTQVMWKLARERFLPRAVLVRRPEGGEAAERLAKLVPFASRQQPIDGKPTAFVCQHYQCQLPTTSPDQLRALLDGLR